MKRQFIVIRVNNLAGLTAHLGLWTSDVTARSFTATRFADIYRGCCSFSFEQVTLLSIYTLHGIQKLHPFDLLSKIQPERDNIRVYT
jgi:hypothetical protein